MGWVYVIIGGLITVFTAILVEWLRKPSLEISIANQVNVDYSKSVFSRPANHAIYLGVMVRNKALPSWARWLSRDASTNCYGIISFHQLDGKDVFEHTMRARWSETPEPLPTIGIIGGKPAILTSQTMLYPPSHMTIPAGELEKLDVAAHFDNDSESYGWSNDNYFSNPIWRNPNWKLNQGNYIVKIKLISSGETNIRLFRLINDISTNNFRLENSKSEDGKLLSK